MTRQTTNYLLDLVHEWSLDWDQLIMACLKYMSEDDVTDMAIKNDFINGETYD